MPKVYEKKLKRNPHGYSGVLIKPMFMLDDTGLLGRKVHHKTLMKQDHLQAQLAERVVALFRHYHIDIPSEGVQPELSSNAWMALAIALATQHVPGFKVDVDGAPKAGRKDVWDKLGQKLILDVRDLNIPICRRC